MIFYDKFGSGSINFDAVVRSFESVFGINGMIIVGEEGDKIEILYKYRVPPAALDFIRRCLVTAESLDEAATCIEKDIKDIMPKEIFVVFTKIELAPEEKVYVFVSRRHSPLNNYEMLLVKELVRLSVVVHRLKEVARLERLLEFFVDFLRHIVVISFAHVSLKKLLSLWANELLNHFELSGVIVAFRHPDGELSEMAGNIPLKLKIIRSVTLETSGVVTGGNNSSFWTVVSSIEAETSTQITMFKNKPFQTFELKFLPVVATVAHNSLKNSYYFHKESEQVEKYKTLTYDVIRTLEDMIEARDPMTRGHSEHVAEIAVRLGEALGLDDDSLEQLRLAALLHDIGKIGIPDSILLKPGPLTPEELKILHEHVVISRKIVERISGFREIVPLIAYHHERWDGKGYPDGLMGMQIPFGARILAIADSIEAMLSDRIYRRALPWPRVREILNEGAGKQWDPDMIKVALDIFKNPPILQGGRREFEFASKEVTDVRMRSSLAYWQVSFLHFLNSLVRKDKLEEEKLAEALTALYESVGADVIGVFFADKKNFIPYVFLSELDTDRNFLREIKIPIENYKKQALKVIKDRFLSLLDFYITPLKYGDAIKGLIFLGFTKSGSSLLIDEIFLELLAYQIGKILSEEIPKEHLPMLIDPSTGFFDVRSIEEKLYRMEQITVACLDFNEIDRIQEIYGKHMANWLKRSTLKLLKEDIGKNFLFAHSQFDRFLILCDCDKSVVQKTLSEFVRRNVGRFIKVGPEYLQIPQINFHIVGTVSKPKDLYKLIENEV